MIFFILVMKNLQVGVRHILRWMISVTLMILRKQMILINERDND
ncbi:hypothetical protein [Escherichia phage dw-ec]|nr:hypothetical protein [Escherichia phage BI-EHEC]UJQ43831.1 hypothetical protein [Escherichia phage dw-ec]